MAAETPTKTAALAKGKRMKTIFILLISLLIAALLTWGGLKLFKKWKQSRILKDEKNSASGSGSSSISAPPAGTGSGGLETVENVKAIQSAINKAHPEAALQVDGIMGPITMAAIKKYYGADAYPLTQASMTKIISGVSPIGFPSASGPKENDDFPLKVGSSGNLVTAVKRMMNGINPKAQLNDKNDQFDQALYNAIITYAGVSYYPVTYDNYLALNSLYNNSKAA